MSEKKYICSIKRLKRLFQISWNLRDWASFTFMQVCSWQEPREWFRLLFLHAFILSYFLEKGCRFICNICRFHRILNFMIHGWTLNRPNTVWRSNIFSYIFSLYQRFKMRAVVCLLVGFLFAFAVDGSVQKSCKYNRLCNGASHGSFPVWKSVF